MYCVWEAVTGRAGQEPHVQAEHHEAHAGRQELTYETHQVPLFVGPQGDDKSGKCVCTASDYTKTHQDVLSGVQIRGDCLGHEHNCPGTAYSFLCHTCSK